MRQKMFMLAAAGLIMAVTSCIDFESQSMSFRYLPDKDTLLLFQQYNGITGSKQEGALSKKGADQLESVMTSAQTFFFSNWIFGYDRADAIKRMEALAKPAGPDERFNDPAARERLRAFNQLLVENITIRNGPFFLDLQGKLCGIQKITILNFSKILAAANHSIRDSIRSELTDVDNGFREFSHETRQLLHQSAAGDQPYIQIEGNRLAFRWPLALDDVIKYIREENKEDKKGGFWFQNFARGGLEFAYVKNHVLFSIGSKDEPFTRLHANSLSAHAYNPRAMEHVKTKYKLQEGLDPIKERDAFLGLAKPAKR